MEVILSVSQNIACENLREDEECIKQYSHLSAAHLKAKQKLTVSENKVLKEIFGPKREKIIGRCRNYTRGPGSSVGIATELRAGRSGIESRWGRDFPPVQTDHRAYPASCKMGTGSFSGVNCGRGVLLTTHPLLVPRSWKSRVIPLPTLWATAGL